MRKISQYIAICVMSLLAFIGCDVHEFPEMRDEYIPFELHLNFDTELPFHKEVTYTRSGEGSTKAPFSRHDFRYVIKAYRTDNVKGQNRLADTTFIFTRGDFEELNYTAHIELREGTYDLRVWCDYVDAGSTEDKYYITSDFGQIILASEENHPGSNDFRDAFRGSVSATVTSPTGYTGEIISTIDNSATVEMSRPLGKYEFVSTDVEAFLTRVLQTMQEQGLLMTPFDDLTFEQILQNVNLEDFQVVFCYEQFMPCSFNMFTDKASGSWMRTTFNSNMQRTNDNEMLLGSDYVFVNETGTTLDISVAVYNKQGEQMSLSRPVPVPIMRSKFTTVRGEFLTSKATGGVSINPGYDGPDFNIPIVYSIR